MTPASLAAHLTRLGFIHDAHDIRWRGDIDKTRIADITGYNRDTVRRYLTGERPIPKTFALCLAAVAAGLEPLE